MNTSIQKTMTTKNLLKMTSRRRSITIGIIILLFGLTGILLFARSTDLGSVSTFGLNSGGSSAVSIPDLVIPSFWTTIVLSILLLLLGLYQLIKGFGENTNKILGVGIFLFIVVFLVWATREKSLNLTGLLRLSAVQALPLVLGALSGILSERAGVVNIAIEGLMLIACLVSVLVSSLTGSLWLGLLAALIASGLLAMAHAVLCIKYKMDQIISGMVINIFSTGITGFVSIKFLVNFPNLNQSPLFPNISIPGLANIPILGPIFFNQNIFFYLTAILLVVINFALYKTRWGLRTRMVGEQPRAADTLGIKVERTRYIAVLLSGLIAGLAGAYLTLGAVGRFNRLMTAGRGFIGLAAMIFGNWNPFGALGASLIFGFTSSLESKLTILQVPIPSQFLLMAPYIATMIILVGVVGSVTAPEADGQPYDKE